MGDIPGSALFTVLGFGFLDAVDSNPIFPILVAIIRMLLIYPLGSYTRRFYFALFASFGIEISVLAISTEAAGAPLGLSGQFFVLFLAGLLVAYEGVRIGNELEPTKRTDLHVLFILLVTILNSAVLAAFWRIATHVKI